MYRSFIREPSQPERFMASWKIAHGASPQIAARERLARLSRQLYEPHAWQHPLGSACEMWENPLIPSGYTYFAQFVAHDCVQSAIPTVAQSLGFLTVHNHRSNYLALDTLYGAGFDGCAHAIFQDDLQQHRRPAKLPLAPMQFSQAGEERCPFRDVPRNDGAPFLGRARAIIADERNDNNVLISQFTVLFTLLHNTIVDRLEANELKYLSSRLLQREAELYSLARALCTQLYQRLVLFDLMKRLLHPLVHERYLDPNCIFMDTADGIALEFPLVLRCGHAMIRPHYEFNQISGRQEELIDVLLTTSRGRPWRMPLDETWIVQWSRFFPTSSRPANISRRIGPQLSSALLSGLVFPEIDSAGSDGLAYRDLASALGTATWSVSPLIAEIRKHVPNLISGSRMLDDRGYREAKMESWLRSTQSITNLDTNEISDLTIDPPLFLFILLEAAFEHDGSCFGVLGSLLIGENIFRVSRNTGQLLDCDSDPPRSFYEAPKAPDYNGACYSARLVNKELAGIHAMADLVAFVSKHNEDDGRIMPLV